MERVIVIGCPGSGKSTFSRALHVRTGLPLFYMDRMFWNADKTTVSASVLLQRLNDVLPRDRWIIDGNYRSTLEMRLQHCDTVFFLDYPLEDCLAGARARLGVARPDMPWIEQDDETHAEFLDYIREFPAHSRPDILRLLGQYSHRNIITFHTRAQADVFLKSAGAIQ